MRDWIGACLDVPHKQVQCIRGGRALQEACQQASISGISLHQIKKWHTSCPLLLIYKVPSPGHARRTSRNQPSNRLSGYVILCGSYERRYMMDLSLDMSAEQTQRVSPTLIAVNQILALSSQE